MNASLKLGEFLPYRINRLAEQVSRSLADVYASRFQITVAQWRVLAVLHSMPGAAAQTIAERTNLDKVKVSRAVNDLEQRGYLQRKPSASDRRARELRLTHAGDALFEAIEPLALEWEGRFLHTLGARDKRRLLSLLSRLETGMAQLAEQDSFAALTEEQG